MHRASDRARRGPSRARSVLAAVFLAQAAVRAAPPSGSPGCVPGALAVRFLAPPLLEVVDGAPRFADAGLREALAGATLLEARQLAPPRLAARLPETALDWRLRVAETGGEEALAVRLLASGLVELAEPDWYLPLLRLPDDPWFPQQWNLARTRAEAAWDLLPEEGPAERPVIAVIDSGVDWTHPDLAEAIWVNPGEDLDGDGVVMDPDDLNGVDDDGNGYVDDLIGWNFTADEFDPPNEPFDRQGHGTRVNGIAGAVTDNGTGVSSAGWSPRLMALRAGIVGGDGQGYIIQTAAAEAIYYAIENGAGILNFSFGGSGTLRTPATVAFGEGLLCFHSAGNAGIGEQDQLDRAVGMVSVAATDSLGCLGEFSNFGEWIDLCAPSGPLPVLVAGSGSVELGDGSSWAAPQAASAAALLWALEPELDNVQVRQRLLESCEALDELPCNAGHAGELGAGLLDLQRLVDPGSAVAAAPARPTRPGLLRAWPNPFNPEARLAAELPQAGFVDLRVVDLLGRTAARLQSGRLPAGRHEFRLDGSQLPGGLYLARLQLDGEPLASCKLLLLR